MTFQAPFKIMTRTEGRAGRKGPGSVGIWKTGLELEEEDWTDCEATMVS